jgi:hypothetical protein
MSNQAAAGWIRVADYRDVDCKGCTCCYVTMTSPVDDVPLCDECEFAEEHLDYQVECSPFKCNMMSGGLPR